MPNYTDIAKVNKAMTFKPIKGKNYAEVKERVNAFRKLYPEGFITTEIVSINEKGVMMKAAVGYYAGPYEEGNFKEILLGTGHAYEFLAKNKNINSTSMIENCETSAVGRALAMCGIGTDISIASYEEVNSNIYSKSEEQEVQTIPETEEQKKAAGEELIGFCKNNGVNVALVAKHFGLVGKPTAAQFNSALDDLKAMIDLNTIPNEWRLS